MIKNLIYKNSYLIIIIYYSVFNTLMHYNSTRIMVKLKMSDDGYKCNDYSDKVMIILQVVVLGR